MTPPNWKGLGQTQIALLQSLREHKEYRATRNTSVCGWTWDTPSHTERILNTLVERRLVTVENGIYRPVPCTCGAHRPESARHGHAHLTWCGLAGEPPA